MRPGKGFDEVFPTPPFSLCVCLPGFIETWLGNSSPGGVFILRDTVYDAFSHAAARLHDTVDEHARLGCFSRVFGVP